MKQRRCATCEFWSDRPSKITGNCVVNPPQLAMNLPPDDKDSLRGFWTITKIDDWCGRYKHYSRLPREMPYRCAHFRIFLWGMIAGASLVWAESWIIGGFM